MPTVKNPTSKIELPYNIIDPIHGCAKNPDRNADDKQMPKASHGNKDISYRKTK